MSHSKSIYRTIEILKRLNSEHRLCVSLLAQEYEVSERTIRRDFELIKELFGDFLSKDRECYRAYKKILLDEVLNASDLLTLANIVNLFNITNKQNLISNKTQELIKKSSLVYDFKTRSYEDLANFEIVKKLEHAIEFQKAIKLHYKTERFSNWSNFLPYKIIFLNENFYLAGVNASKNSVELRRLTMIQEVQFSNKTFFKDAKVIEFFQNIQTPWASFEQKRFSVQLRVQVKIRRFFYRKKYLPSQKILKRYENGDILVEYKITNFREIEELIIKWLPKIEIIEPRRLKKYIKKSLEAKYKAILQKPT